MSNKFDCLLKSTLQSVISEFFREDEILAAKQIISQYADTSLCPAIQPCLKKRIGDNKCERSVEDILSIFTALDESGLRPRLPFFCAVALSRIPETPDEASDLAVIKKEITNLRVQVDTLVGGVHRVQDSEVTFMHSVKPVYDSTTLNGAVGANSGSSERFAASSGSLQVLSAPCDDAVSARAQASSLDTITITTDSYAAAVRAVNSPADEPEKIEEFQVMTHKRNRKKKTIQGCQVDNPSFSGVKKKAVVCVSRLNANASVAAVSDYLKSCGLHVCSCYHVGLPNSQASESQDNESVSVRKTRDYATMRVCVYQSDLNKIGPTVYSELWPEGVTVRPWVFKAKPSA